MISGSLSYEFFKLCFISCYKALLYCHYLGSYFISLDFTHRLAAPGSRLSFLRVSEFSNCDFIAPSIAVCFMCSFTPSLLASLPSRYPFYAYSSTPFPSFLSSRRLSVLCIFPHSLSISSSSPGVEEQEVWRTRKL